MILLCKPCKSTRSRQDVKDQRQRPPQRQLFTGSSPRASAPSSLGDRLVRVAALTRGLVSQWPKNLQACDQHTQINTL